MLEAEPSIGQYLSDSERAEAGRLVVPTQVIARGAFHAVALSETANPFAALVLNGMLMQRIQVGEQLTLRLLGPGDVISLTQRTRSMLINYADCRVASRTRVALLGREVEAAVQRWPGLLAGLHGRLAEQADRIATQLAISQLPRVDQRILAGMWLLAESWGRVTPAGTTLPVDLTHDALGCLIGARRSTVTLALSELAERGALIKQGRGWLLIEEPPVPAGHPPDLEEPKLELPAASPWRAAELNADELARPVELDHASLLAHVQRLRQEHERHRAQVREQLERLASDRAQRGQPRREHDSTPRQPPVTPPVGPS